LKKAKPNWRSIGFIGFDEVHGKIILTDGEATVGNSVHELAKKV